MASLRIEIPVPRHVGIDDAKERMQSLLDKLKEDAPPGMIMDVRKQWVGYNATFSFKAKGHLVTGKLAVGHNHVVIDGQMPFFLAFFKGKITNMITRRANELMAA